MFSREGGVQMLISIETHITFDFPVGGGGSEPPIPASGSAHDLAPLPTNESSTSGSSLSLRPDTLLCKSCAKTCF